MSGGRHVDYGASLVLAIVAHANIWCCKYIFCGAVNIFSYFGANCVYLCLKDYESVYM